jgi:CRP-like cAMP-binding protein
VAVLWQHREAAEGEALLVQGEEGHELFILDAGECVATIKNGACEQEVKRYAEGAVFGEKALLENAPRAATVTAVGSVVVWAVSREAFEAKHVLCGSNARPHASALTAATALAMARASKADCRCCSTAALGMRVRLTLRAWTRGVCTDSVRSRSSRPNNTSPTRAR